MLPPATARFVGAGGWRGARLRRRRSPPGRRPSPLEVAGSALGDATAAGAGEGESQTASSQRARPVGAHDAAVHGDQALVQTGGLARLWPIFELDGGSLLAAEALVRFSTLGLKRESGDRGRPIARPGVDLEVTIVEAVPRPSVRLRRRSYQRTRSDSVGLRARDGASRASTRSAAERRAHRTGPGRTTRSWPQPARAEDTGARLAVDDTERALRD